MRKTVALVTWAGLPEGSKSERLLVPHLASAGVDAEFVDWRDVSCDFKRFDLAVLRTCWNYHLHVKEFLLWLSRTNNAVPVLNPPGTVVWNHNKSYLRELELQGIPVAPAIFVES